MSYATTFGIAGAPAARTASRNRRASVQLLRFACACAVAFDHMHPQTGLDMFSPLVPFLIFFGAFSVGSLKGRDRVDFLANRAQRALLPWIAASVFYVVLELAISRTAPWDFKLTDPLSLIVGPTIHLWFLPFVLLVSLLIAIVAPWANSAWRVGALAVCVAPLAIGTMVLHSRTTMPDPFGQWSYSFAAIAFGVLSALALKRGAPRIAFAFLGVVAGGALLLGCVNEPLQLLCGAALCELAWRLDFEAPWVLALGEVSFGIYLIHPFFMLVYYKFFYVPHDLLGVIVVVAMSAAAAAVAKRTPLVNKLV